MQNAMNQAILSKLSSDAALLSNFLDSAWPMLKLLCDNIASTKDFLNWLSKFSAVTQYWLSSAKHFFEFSKTNVEYSIIIWVMYYVYTPIDHNHDQIDQWPYNLSHVLSSWLYTKKVCDLHTLCIPTHLKSTFWG